jgi:hypothetical protein
MAAGYWERDGVGCRVGMRILDGVVSGRPGSGGRGGSATLLSSSAILLSLTSHVASSAQRR